MALFVAVAVPILLTAALAFQVYSLANLDVTLDFMRAFVNWSVQSGDSVAFIYTDA
jgi:hypothetical protein